MPPPYDEHAVGKVGVALQSRYDTDQLAVQARLSGHSSSCLCLLLQCLAQVRQLTPHTLRLHDVVQQTSVNLRRLLHDRDLPWMTTILAL